MLGGQQFHAYKTIMSKSRYLPRHSALDVRLYRVIVWGAVIIVTMFTAAVVATNIARINLDEVPFYLLAIPVMLALLFAWWWIDTAPLVARWTIALCSTSAVLGVTGLVIWAYLHDLLSPETDPYFVGFSQVAAIALYLCAVAVEAWRQIVAGPLSIPPSPDTAR